MTRPGDRVVSECLVGEDAVLESIRADMRERGTKTAFVIFHERGCEDETEPEEGQACSCGALPVSISAEVPS